MDVLVTVTVAFEITALVGSVTVPTIEPYRTCAEATGASYPRNMRQTAKPDRITTPRENLCVRFTVPLPKRLQPISESYRNLSRESSVDGARGMDRSPLPTTVSFRKVIA